MTITAYWADTEDVKDLPKPHFRKIDIRMETSHGDPIKLADTHRERLKTLYQAIMDFNNAMIDEGKRIASISILNVDSASDETVTVTVKDRASVVRQERLDQ